VEEEVHTTETETTQQDVKVNVPKLKPALKTPAHSLSPKPTPMVGLNDPNLGSVDESHEMPSTSGSSKMVSVSQKTVRFASDLEKENSTASSSDQVTNTVTIDDLQPSHSKIISEVLKKYPDLVKDRQNIRLKIVTKGAETNVPQREKSKVSYIVLKSTSSPDSVGTYVLKKPPQTQASTAANKAFWDNGETTPKKPSGAENVTGPWLCAPCGGGEQAPMEFETYYAYRRHLVVIT
jgi:hypothetical protein